MSGSPGPRETPRGKAIPDRENVGVTADRETERGRRAESPRELPAKGWLDVLWRTKRQVGRNNLSILAAGVAYYSFLAVVPALVVAIAIFALVANADAVARHLSALNRVIPPEVMPLLQDQLTRIVKNNTAAGVSATIGILLACHSSANATKAMMRGMNIAYQEEEKRGILRFNGLAILLTLGEIVGVLLTIGILAGLPMILHRMGIENAWVAWLRWPLLVVLSMIGVSVIYRWGPSRTAPKWRWLSWGATLAAFLWVLGSGIFSYYVGKFGHYEKAYGSLGAVIIFQIWLYLSAYTILIGAQLNAEMERQTHQDTTASDEPKPIGERGAVVADTVGESKK